MSAFEICLISGILAITVSIIVLIAVMVRKTNIERTRAAILSHRELWLYYLNEPNLKGY